MIDDQDIDIQQAEDELTVAAEQGNIREVVRLISVLAPTVSQKNFLSPFLSPLLLAANYGHLECVKALSEAAVLDKHNSVALECAARGGHAQCVRFLIPLSNPKHKGSIALQIAALFGRTECVDLLYDVSEPEAALDILRSEKSLSAHKWEYLEKRVEAERQNKVLQNAVDTPTYIKTRKI